VSEAADTDPDELAPGEPAQPADPLVCSLNGILGAQTKTRELVEAVGRDVTQVGEAVGHMARELSGAIKAFTDLHTELQQMELAEAAERHKMHADIRLVLEAVRGIGTRLTAAEETLATLREQSMNGHG